jgi:hypothetical protein
MKAKILFIIILLLLTTLVSAANDPGHDTLYVEEQGDSEINGSINITQNLSVDGGKIKQSGVFTLYADDSTPATGTYISATTGGNIYLEGQGNIYLKRTIGGDGVFIGSGAAPTDLNVSGALYVQSSTLTVNGQNVCLADGSNCLNGGAGSVTSVSAAAGTPLSASPTTGAVVINISIPACSGNDKLTYDGSSFSCATDQEGSGSLWTNSSGVATYSGEVDIGGALRLSSSSNDITIKNTAQDKDLIFNVNDGGVDKEIFRIDGATGRIGIGTGSGTPFAGLDIKDQGFYIRSTTDNQYISIRSADNYASGFSLYEDSTQRTLIRQDYNANKLLDIYDATNASSRLVIDPQGNVGIGTTNPGEALDVAGNINATGDICITGGNCLSTVSAGGSGGAGWTNTSTTTSTSLNVSVDSGTLFVDSTNNNVGIGTTTPVQKLDVDGTIIARGTGDTLSNPSTNVGNGTRIDLNVGGNNPYGIGIGEVESGTYPIWFQTGNLNGGGFQWYIGTTEYMRVHHDGNVGIGETSPSSKLEVNGNVELTNLYDNDATNFFDGSCTYGVASISSTGALSCASNPDTDTTCDGTSCAVTNTGTLDGFNGADFVAVAGDTMTGSLTFSGNSDISGLSDLTLSDITDLQNYITGPANRDLFIRTGDTNGAGDTISFFVDTNTGSGTTYVEALTIYGNGNIGIGDTTPDYALDVEGGIINAAGGFIVDTVSGNPSSPATGQIWLDTS